MKPHEAKTGDQVRLRIGERRMEVVAYSSAGRVCCRWIDETSGRPETAWFDAEDLVPVEVPTAHAGPGRAADPDKRPGMWRPLR